MASRALRFPGRPNPYQVRKAKAIASILIQRACTSEVVTLADLPVLMAHFSEADWRAISFDANVPVVDKPARIMALAFVQGLL